MSTERHIWFAAVVAVGLWAAWQIGELADATRTAALCSPQVLAKSPRVGGTAGRYVSGQWQAAVPAENVAWERCRVALGL